MLGSVHSSRVDADRLNHGMSGNLRPLACPGLVETPRHPGERPDIHHYRKPFEATALPRIARYTDKCTIKRIWWVFGPQKNELLR